ncbi:MarR family winged helix-turn-helix transcriptional regulator [Serratia quinivorans]|uniref:MarR family winged helix-turn-helix transcriptional regulator n=1 Tax=Serratia quinivorans TaxID=137545 RepID=UPI00217BB24E|nr:MarR family transcriptional regulator [Serratia quinivorans]CAI0855041.1 Salmolysin [Serratia quinivorans]CAI0880541.1 Salmolysin [Serratia quinivorans]CAI1155390.1 Salmolysin [Serratia quinivorans]CAI1502451.1 Salmolysin [Serratia quinivorans]CAI2047492.1 Salmolysin [Serratia quinivorans]
MSSGEPDLWFSYVRSHRLMIREIEQRLAQAGLPTYAWYDTLWGLESHPQGARRMYELADVLVIERYNLTRLVDRLEKEGLVTRTRLAEDGRAAFVAITEKGKVLRKQMWAIYQATVAELFLQQFTPEQQAAFASALDHVSEATRKLG